MIVSNELRRLLHVARVRSLAEYGRETIKLPLSQRKGRRTWKKVPLAYETIDAATQRARDVLASRPEFIAELERSGRERALIYKTLVLTGLRKGELASLTVGQLELDTQPAYALLHAADEKSRQGAEVPLRRDLAVDLKENWLADKLEALRAEARASGTPIPVKLPAQTPLFDIPAGLLRILDRDLKAAAIPKRDERGRTVDVHAMRTTFGTHLSKAGVPLRTAQAAMRHSDPKLTANVYTNPKLLDVAGALDTLPALPTGSNNGDDHATATGTDPSFLVPLLVPDADNPGTNQSSHGKGHGDRDRKQRSQRASVSSDHVNRKAPLSSADNGVAQARATGLEPATFGSTVRCSDQLSYAPG